ncbi:type III-B CRISPR module RAMP protein Cmr6 [Maridesulfovibrio sp.]|uniref:type III-B CRISPR module RAMP protein Cmr6 n=1 Tax=Maridesulfovibrio sp. TaxID=2795000 RepID=UPI003AFFF265
MPHRAVRDNFRGRFDGVGENLGLKICKLNEKIDLPPDKKDGNSGGNKPENKEKALRQMANFRFGEESAKAYKIAFERLGKAAKAHADCEIFEIKTSTRVLLGTGNASVFEFGFNLNYPWGVPYISGSTLKGAVSSYLARNGGKDWEIFDGAEKSRLQVDMFGGRLQGDSKSYVGLVTFLDAWMCPWASRDGQGDWFDMDIITPHYTSYYNGEGAPTGMDDPKPIKIAALCPGLRFQVILQGPEKHRKYVRRMLWELLEEEGIGGKTAVGYGRFEYIKNAQERSEEIGKKIQDVELVSELVELYKAYKNINEHGVLFAEKLREYGYDSDSGIEGMWKSLLPLDYLAIQLNDDLIKTFKDLKIRYKDFGNNISHWKKRFGVTDLSKSPEGKKLFDLMLAKWPEQIYANTDTKVVNELAYKWVDLSYSADELLDIIEGEVDLRWPKRDKLREYIEGNFFGDELELLVVCLDDAGL